MHTLDLAESNSTSSYMPLVGYTYPSKKYTHQDHHPFYTWLGLRLWYITGRKRNDYLTARTEAEVKAIRGDDWQYVPDLHELLEKDLAYNSADYPFLLVMMQNVNVSVVWTAGKVNTPWLEIVTRFVANQYRG